MAREETSHQPSQATRVRVAQVLGLVALVASLLGALGPAERVRTVYSWPPAELPAGTPNRVWYTPLLLVRHEPEVISTDVPCRLPPGLEGGETGLVLSTARYPERAGGLAITRSRSHLVVSVGREVLDRVDLPADGGGADCAHRITIAAGTWSISGGGTAERQGAVETMPTVYGLFSELDLRSSSSLSVDVTTIPHATRTTIRQALAWIIAALAAVGALLLIALEPRARHRLSLGSGSVRHAIARAHPADALVAVVLVAWCVIAPVNFDDGWVIQREQMFGSAKGFSIYYANLAANLPLDYWLEWLHHWLAEVSTAVLVFRLPVLIVLMAVWVLCRWIVAQIQASSVGAGRIGTWTLAIAFLLGSLAWGMTMRPEPVTALFVIGVTACMVRFLLRQDASSVVLAAALAVLALTAHPAGVVSLASVVVAAPRLYAWARARLAQAVTIISAASALLATLAFVGSDLDQRLADAQIVQDTSVPGRDELQRYAYLWEEPFGTPLRRVFVAITLLTVVAFVLRQDRTRRGLQNFPTSVLAVGLVLLVATPSKWPSHFGALVGIGALAIATEAARLRGDGRSPAGSRAWPLLAILAATLSAAWSWWERKPWNPLDLMTLDWTPAWVSRVGLSQLAVLLPALLLAASFLIALIRGPRRQLGNVPARVAGWIPAAVAIPAILFTMGVPIVDAAKTSSWTMIRQNLETIAGDPGCGLAEDVLVSRRDSAHPLQLVGGSATQSLPAWVPAAPVEGLPRFVLGPAGTQPAYSPWFRLPADRRTGLFVTGTPGPSDTLWLEWGRLRGTRVESLGSDEITDIVSEPSGNSAWRFYSAGDLTSSNEGAIVVRTEYRAGVAPGVALAITSPVTYTNERLAALMEGDASRTLVYPELYLYFPCTSLPALRQGIVEVPQRVVISNNTSPPLRYHVTSPFVGLLDLYHLERVPVADTPSSVDRLRIFEVDRLIPGAMEAPPTTTTVAS